MKAAEVAAVSRLVIASIRQGFAGSYSPATIEAVTLGNSVEAISRHAPRQTDYVLRSESRIVGMIGLKRNEIGHLFVHPAESARGHGRMLVDFARKTFLDMGHAEMVVLASLNSVGFYARCGFAERARGSFDVGDGLPLEYVRMTCEIGGRNANLGTEGD